MKYPWDEYEKELNSRFPNLWESGDILVKEDDINGPQYYFSGTALRTMGEGMDGMDVMDDFINVKFQKISSAVISNDVDLEILKKLFELNIISGEDSLKLYKLLYSNEKENRTLAVGIINAKFDKYVVVQQD